MQIVLSVFILQYSNETAITALIDCTAAVQTNTQRGCKHKLFLFALLLLQRYHVHEMPNLSNFAQSKFIHKINCR